MTWKAADEVRSADGTRLALFRLEPGASHRGDALLVHGYADHMGRYKHVAEALAASGFRVTGVDLRGHGLSDGRRGHVVRWSDYLADLDAAVKGTGVSSPIIVAHSMGGLAVLDWLRARGSTAAKAVVLSGPLLRPAVKAPRWKTGAARLLSRVLPAMAMGNEIPPGDVSRHPDITAAYKTDTLVFTTATPRWYTEMMAAAARVTAAAPAMRTPALCMWGTDDRIVAPDAVAAFAASWGGPMEAVPWKGLYHEILNEPERADVLARATAWLQSAGG